MSNIELSKLVPDITPSEAAESVIQFAQNTGEVIGEALKTHVTPENVTNILGGLALTTGIASIVGERGFRSKVSGSLYIGIGAMWLNQHGRRAS